MFLLFRFRGQVWTKKQEKNEPRQSQKLCSNRVWKLQANTFQYQLPYNENFTL